VLSRGHPLAAVFFAAYATVSLSRHTHLRTGGYDLGIFEQAVRRYASLQAPVSELKGHGFNLLGDHFHPVLAVLAPLYRLAPGPATLLVAQAALLAVSVIPVTRLAARVVGPRAGTAIGVAYGLSWGLQSAVGFDFHEVAFAVPMLACCGERLARRQWGPAVAWALPLVLVKEDMPLTVAAIGAYVFLRGRRALGAAVMAYAVVAGLLIVTVVIPSANPSHVYGYAQGLASPVDGLAPKLHTLVWLVLPTAFLALRSPLLLLVVPTLVWRFLRASPAYWGTGFHYSAVLMPIVFVAFIDALDRRPAARVRAAAPWAALAVALALTAATALPLVDLVRPSTWRVDPAVAQARAMLDLVPSGASVAASNLLAPQLTAGHTVYLFPTYPTGSLRPDWIAALDDEPWPMTAEEIAAAFDRLPAIGYRLVAHRAGVRLYRHAPVLCADLVHSRSSKVGGVGARGGRPAGENARCG
jgi:uncharacterized membrane protein